MWLQERIIPLEPKMQQQCVASHLESGIIYSLSL